MATTDSFCVYIATRQIWSGIYL